MKTTTAALRRNLCGVLAATALGGVSAALTVPPATAGKDPCVASEVARTVGKVVQSVGDYLDSHPETNQVVTGALQNPPSPQSIGAVNAYFNANPKVQSDIQTVTAPLGELTTKCRLSVGLPEVLGLLQAAQDQTGPGMQLVTRVPAATPPMAVR